MDAFGINMNSICSSGLKQDQNSGVIRSQDITKWIKSNMHRYLLMIIELALCGNAVLKVKSPWFQEAFFAELIRIIKSNLDFFQIPTP